MLVLLSIGTTPTSFCLSLTIKAFLNSEWTDWTYAGAACAVNMLLSTYFLAKSGKFLASKTLKAVVRDKDFLLEMNRSHTVQESAACHPSLRSIGIETFVNYYKFCLINQTFHRCKVKYLLFA